jgi:class 3 adenylate cyclase
MMEAVHRYDGYVAQSTGDGIFALFGAPVAHEDHPQRALYVALRMQEELKRYSDRIRSAGSSSGRSAFRTALGTVVRQRAPALGAELLAWDSFGPAFGTAHEILR